MPSVTKKTTMVFSVAVRDKLICHGVIARVTAVSKPNSFRHFSCGNSVVTRKKERNIVAVPKNALAARTENGDNPNNAINGIDAYE